MRIPGGATIWARQSINSKIFEDKPDKWFKIWFYLVNKANHKDQKGFKRGSFFTKYEWIAEATRATRNEIDHCIRYLKSATMIATQKATRGMIITILNYEKYQNLNNYKSDTKSDGISDIKATQKRHKSDTINKNDKECKNEKNEIHPSDFVLFWETYPRKVGKQECLKIWLNSKKNKTRPSIDKIIQSLEIQKVSEDWTKENGRYIPNPSTWLNQGRWDDELRTPHKGKGKEIKPTTYAQAQDAERRQMVRMLKGMENDGNPESDNEGAPQTTHLLPHVEKID